MFQDIDKLFQQKNVLYHQNEGIMICPVENNNAGVVLAIEILNTTVDRKTALSLSGGRTPKELYKLLTHEEKILPGAVGMVDERFGKKFHTKSNELMIRDTGLLRYLEIVNIPFYPILSDKEDRKEIAQAYDEKLRSFNATFQKSVAILGIGSDGHTAGIAGNRPNFQNPLFDSERRHLLVSEFDDEKGIFKDRVTMTFLGLTMMDLLLVLVFGEDKRDALTLMMEKGSEEDIPARFYKRPDIASKTIIITDQAI